MGRRRRRQCLLFAGPAGARRRRWRARNRGERPQLGGRDADPHLRQRGAKTALPARSGKWSQTHRLLPDGTARWFGCRRHSRQRQAHGDGYLLSGSKQFITSGATADIALVIAVTDADAGKRGISAFIVDTKAPGYTVTRIEKKMGQNASDTCEIRFDDVL